MSKSRGSPRKFAEKIALLNKKEAEGTSEFEKILKEVKESTRAPDQPQQYWGLPTRSASFSNWETFGPPIQQPQQQQQHHPQYHPNGSQYLSATQHVQYSPHPGQLQQTRPHVINTTRHSSHQLNHQHLHQQPANLTQHLSQVHQPRLQPTIYVEHPASPGNEYLHTTTTDQAVRRSSYAKSSNGLAPVQTNSIEVPNIAIFPIDDEYQHTQQLAVDPLSTTNEVAQNTLGDGHYRNDCSNSPISLSRSLPNIANLSVSPSSTSQMTAQPMIGQNLGLFGGQLKSGTSQVALVTSTNNNNDCYLQDTSGPTIYPNNDDYSSLPSFQQPMPTINRHDQNRQSQSHISLSDSWQQATLASAPSSAAPTPPGPMGQGSPYGSQQQSPQQQQPMIHSPDSSPHRQQQSPQTLHPEYYPSPMQPQNQLMRASSTNVINKYPTNDLLEAPRINGNLSKSTDANYGYIENYATGDGFSNDLADGGNIEYTDNHLDSPYLTTNNSSSPIVRSRSENNIENMNALNDYQFTNQYIETSSQQFSDTSQNQFYE